LLTPKDAVAHQRVGFALFRLNRPEEAISIYQTALGVANSNATRAGIHFQMGDARRSMGAFGAAIDEYQKGIALGGRVPIGLALSRAASGDVDGAIREYEAVLQYDPDHPVVLNNLAYAFANKGIHLDRALSMSQRSRVLEPGNTFNADTLGWIYFKLGRLEDAESTLMEGMRLEGGTRGTVLDHLAAVMDARNVWTPDRRELRQLLVQDLTARQVAKVKELLGRVRAQ
jgi:tetratricopeptide (TPR) repeat protein